MPHKYATKKGWHVPKQKHKVRNWSEYNQALINRGRIDFWLSEDAIEKWHEPYTPNDGIVNSVILQLWFVTKSVRSII